MYIQQVFSFEYFQSWHVADVAHILAHNSISATLRVMSASNTLSVKCINQPKIHSYLHNKLPVPFWIQSGHFIPTQSKSSGRNSILTSTAPPGYSCGYTGSMYSFDQVLVSPSNTWIKFWLRSQQKSGNNQKQVPMVTKLLR